MSGYFGRTKHGEDVYKFWLKNEFLEIGILTYGGTITDILMADKNGHKENIVLGYDNIQDYEEKSPYFGCITGRNAGRITKGEFTLNGKNYKLAQNNGINHLHGGDRGLDKRVWSGVQIDNKLTLRYFSEDGEEGYPGAVQFIVTYELIDSKLRVKYKGIANDDTIINLTNHTYFNLTGDVTKGNSSHILKIAADKIAALDCNNSLTGEFLDVTDTPFDFREEKTIGQDIEKDHEQLKFGNGYDHPFILNQKKKIEISAKGLESGRVVEIETDQPVVVFYSGNFMGEEGRLSNGKDAIFRGGFCLETQDLPNYINIKNWNKKIYNLNNPYTAETVYRFKIEEK